MRGGTASIGNDIVANGGAQNPTANGGEGGGQVDPDGEGNDREDVPYEPTIWTEAQLREIDPKL